MAEGRQSSNWDVASLLAALVVNCHRDPRRSGPVGIERFHPYLKRRTEVVEADVTVLREAFCN
jgi:primosomal replication protein N